MLSSADPFQVLFASPRAPFPRRGDSVLQTAPRRMLPQAAKRDSAAPYQRVVTSSPIVSNSGARPAMGLAHPDSDKAANLMHRIQSGVRGRNDSERARTGFVARYLASGTIANRVAAAATTAASFLAGLFSFS